MPRVCSAFLVVTLVVSGCSDDPTSSEEYQALEEELAAAEAQLSEVTAERGALLAAAASTSGSSDDVSRDVGQGLVPDGVVALIDQWKQATKESMGDLYTSDGFHLYGDQKFTGDDIGEHLVNPAIENEELTPLLLVAEGTQRWVVTQGFKNTVGSIIARSGISWEIIEEAPGELKFAQSAWFKQTG